jgi:hypothetical protein
MHVGAIGHSVANFFLRSSPKRGKVKISLRVDCHEVNRYGGTETVAEFGAAVIGWVTNWGTEMLLFRFFLYVIYVISLLLFPIIHPYLFAVLFPHSLHK